MYLMRLLYLSLFLAFCLINCRADSEINNLIPPVADFQQDQSLDFRRGDIEVDDNAFQGYSYPKPSIPFELPDFVMVNAEGKNFVPREDERVKSSEQSETAAFVQNYEIL